jgi:hypothetical protein
VSILSSREGVRRGLWDAVLFLGPSWAAAAAGGDSRTHVAALPPRGAWQHRAEPGLPVVDVRRLLTACVQLRERGSQQRRRVRHAHGARTSLAAVGRHRGLGRRRYVVVALPGAPDRTARAGMVVVRVAAQSLGYLAAGIPRTFAQLAARVAGMHSSRGSW